MKINSNLVSGGSCEEFAGLCQSETIQINFTYCSTFSIL